MTPTLPFCKRKGSKGNVFVRVEETKARNGEKERSGEVVDRERSEWVCARVFFLCHLVTDSLGVDNGYAQKTLGTLFLGVCEITRKGMR